MVKNINSAYCFRYSNEYSHFWCSGFHDKVFICGFRAYSGTLSVDQADIELKEILMLLTYE